MICGNLNDHINLRSKYNVRVSSIQQINLLFVTVVQAHFLLKT